jgi:hypothetical protein
MNKNIDLLFTYVKQAGYFDVEELTPSVLIDYFGYENIDNNTNLNILLALYIGLIKHKGISKQIIENCFMTNRLDEMIHKKYTHNKSSYYINYCVKNIKIGNTYVNNETISIEELNILTDDYCSNCCKIGYITQNNCNGDAGRIYDCCKCFQFICNQCSHYSNEKMSYICINCDNTNIIKCINQKLSTYKHIDVKKFGIKGNIQVNDVLELFRKQKFKCYICEDIVLSCNWKPKCLYQFSLDRINETLPHDKTNILISCYYCNCISYFNEVLQCNENIKYIIVIVINVIFK